MSLLRHPSFILVLILLVVLLFGSKKLPDLAKSVGQSMKILKKDVKDLRDDSAPAPAAPPATGAPTPQESQTTTAGASGPEAPRTTPDVVSPDVEGDPDTKA